MRGRLFSVPFTSTTRVYNSSKVSVELLITFFIQRLTLLMRRSYIPTCHDRLCCHLMRFNYKNFLISFFFLNKSWNDLSALLNVLALSFIIKLGVPLLLMSRLSARMHCSAVMSCMISRCTERDNVQVEITIKLYKCFCPSVNGVCTEVQLNLFLHLKMLQCLLHGVR